MPTFTTIIQHCYWKYYPEQLDKKIKKHLNLKGRSKTIFADDMFFYIKKPQIIQEKTTRANT